MRRSTDCAVSFTLLCTHSTLRHPTGAALNPSAPHCRASGPQVTDPRKGADACVVHHVGSSSVVQPGKSVSQGYRERGRVSSVEGIRSSSTSTE
ncbi:hypothetical protein J437_LFUL012380 [Ladona fulva]|uniref:Uncharacterized protein n=1 Tax=Ladona fulva TaxID=123851 RepID=A0A8K0KH08_LADFU|nr:hypothetical protein J437_LFUL012380 [Ladona fulva]